MTADVRLDEQALEEWVVAQRWFGSKAREVTSLGVLDMVPLRLEPRLLASVMVEARFAPGTHEVYQVPVAFRPVEEGWSESVISETGGLTIYDALADPEEGQALLELMRANARLESEHAVSEFHWVEGTRDPGPSAVVRPMGAEQSNSSLVFDEALALKLYRRVEAGVNPELELLRFLTDRGFESVPALAGWYEYTGRLMEATLGVMQEFLPGARDGWELALEELGSEPDAFLERVRALGEVTGRLHTALGSDASNPAFAPEEPSSESLGLLTATIDEEIERIFLDLPEDGVGRADRRARRGRARAAPPADPRGVPRQGDPHPRRLPPRADHHVPPRLGGARLRGRAGAGADGAAPQAFAAARRGGDDALVRVRRVGVARSCAAWRRPRTGRSGRATSSSTPTSTPWTRPCCPRAGTGWSSCSRSSSSRRPCTSCATS